MMQSKFRVVRRNGIDSRHGTPTLKASSSVILTGFLAAYLHLVLFDFGRGKSDS
jgi:hypothetical protein